MSTNINREQFSNAYADFLSTVEPKSESNSQQLKLDKVSNRNRIIVEETAKLVIGSGCISTEGVTKEKLLGTESMNCSQIKYTKVSQDGGNVNKLKQQINECLSKIGVTSRKENIQLANEFYRILSQTSNFENVFRRETPVNNEQLVPLSSLCGVSAASLYNGDSGAGLRSAFDNRELKAESFGLTTDNIQMDNTSAIRLAVYRKYNSILNKLYDRNIIDSPTITYALQCPEVYNLFNSMSDSGNIRKYNRTLLIDTKAERSSILNTTPVRIEALVDNDPTGEFLYNSTQNLLKIGEACNLMDLALDKTNAKAPNAGIDYTDLISEGGVVSRIILEVTDGSNTSVVNVFTKSLPDAMFVSNPNSSDSGNVIMNINKSQAFNSDTIDINTNAPATVFAGFTTTTIAANTVFSCTFNRKLGELSSGGSVAMSNTMLHDTLTTNVITDEKHPDVVKMKALKFKVVAFEPEVYWSEENMRKTVTAIRVGSLQRQVQIQVGKNIIVDLSIMETPEDGTLKVVGDAMEVGNSIRAIQTMISRIEDTYMITANDIDVILANNSIVSSNISLASFLCRPYVIKDKLDLTDAFSVANLKQAELATDIHARFTQAMLRCSALLMGKTLYRDNLEAGEGVVLRCLAYGPLADISLGIKNYHANLDDVQIVNPESSADTIITLPNGIRVEIVKTNFTNWKNKLYFVPYRERDGETGVISFGTVKDAGMLSCDYKNITNTGGVSRRFVVNTREQLIITNPIAIVLEVNGWEKLFTQKSALGSIAGTVNDMSDPKTDTDDSNSETP